MPFTKAIFDTMRNDASLVSMLGGGADSIFTGKEIPPGGVWPLVQAYGFSQMIDGGTKNKGGVKFTKNVRVMSRVVSSTKEADDIAEVIRLLFNRKPFALTGYNVLVVEAKGPMEVPSDEHVTVLEIPITVHAMEI